MAFQVIYVIFVRIYLRHVRPTLALRGGKFVSEGRHLAERWKALVGQRLLFFEMGRHYMVCCELHWLHSSELGDVHI